VIFEWRPDHLLKTLGQVDDLRPLFPNGYEFYSIHQAVRQSGTETKFGLFLKETDLASMSENVLAIPKEILKGTIVSQLLNAYCII
jgi:hypothetical protein